MSKSSLHLVPYDRSADRLADDEPHDRGLPRGGLGRCVRRHGGWDGEVDDERPGTGPCTASDRRGEESARGEPVCPRQHRSTGGQTEMLLRPLRRREDRMARPARVRIRRRKPCTLWRRRLFGWYVLLLTSLSPVCRQWVGSAGPGCGLPAERSVPVVDPHRAPAEGAWRPDRRGGGGWRGRGHAAPVDSGSTSQRYGLARNRVKPSPRPGPATRAGPVDNVLIHRQALVSVPQSRVPHGGRPWFPTCSLILRRIVRKPPVTWTIQD